VEEKVDPRVEEVKRAIKAELRSTIPPSIDVMRDIRFEAAAKQAITICDRYLKES
jgi:hypothetical protein